MLLSTYAQDDELTPITYKEAAEVLGVGQSTIRNAVRANVLTRLHRAGQLQHVVKEQVELFKGKKQIRVTLLSSDERKLWEDIKDQVENVHSRVSLSRLERLANNPTITVKADIKDLLEAALELGVPIQFLPQTDKKKLEKIAASS